MIVLEKFKGKFNSNCVIEFLTLPLTSQYKKKIMTTQPYLYVC